MKDTFLSHNNLIADETIDNAEVVALADPHEDSLNQCKEILNIKVSCFKNHLEI